MSESRKVVEEFYDDLKDYVNTRIDLASLKTTEKAAEVLSTLITKSAFMILLFFAVFFGSVTLGFYIGMQRDSLVQGFLFVTGGYFVLVLLLLIIKDTWLKNPLLNIFIKQLYKNERHEKD